jgi:hypothetical protein
LTYDLDLQALPGYRFRFAGARGLGGGMLLSSRGGGTFAAAFCLLICEGQYEMHDVTGDLRDSIPLRFETKQNAFTSAIITSSIGSFECSSGWAGPSAVFPLRSAISSPGAIKNHPRTRKFSTPPLAASVLQYALESQDLFNTCTGYL